MTENQRPQLDYAPQSPWHRRRPARRVVILCFLLLTLVAAMRWGGQIAQRAKANYWFSWCMTHRPPSNFIAYSAGQTPEQTDELLASNPSYRSSAILNNQTAVGYVPDAWQRFYSAWSPTAVLTSGNLFLGERGSRSGSRRLVCADVAGMPLMGSIPVQVRVFQPPVALGPARLRTATAVQLDLGVTGRDSWVLRIYAGQRDPVDASHFTIICEMGSERSIIDGWLKDNDVVILEARRPGETTPVTSPAPPSPVSSP